MHKINKTLFEIFRF